MNGDCPNCGSKNSLSLIRETEAFNVRGEAIPVAVEYHRCRVCGEEMLDLQRGRDPLDEAYREYRRRKGMVQPEEIRAFRQQWGLTQKEFSALLGIGVATLSRYENGALQEQAHDQVLKSGMQPGGLRRLLEGRPGVFSRAKREALLEQLRQGQAAASLLNFLSEQLGADPPGIYSGFSPLQVDKLVEVVKYFCYPEPVYKTKLMKLLFYADFKYYKDFGRALTGCQYAHLPYGPVPDRHDLLIGALITEIPALHKEEVWNNDTPGETLHSQEAADISQFENSEVLVLAAVKEFFKDYSARRITDFSHQEKGYRETKNGQKIPYSYAKDLRL